MQLFINKIKFKFVEEFINWMDLYMNELQSLELFNEDDELFKNFSIRSNNFSTKELAEEESNWGLTEEDVIAILGEPDEIIENACESNILESLGFDKDYIEDQKKSIFLEDYMISLKSPEEIRITIEALKSIVFGLVESLDIKLSNNFTNPTLKETALTAEYMLEGGNVVICYDENGRSFMRDDQFLDDL